MRNLTTCQSVNHEYRVGSSTKVRFFRHYFRVCEKKNEKNVFLKHFLHSFTNSNHSVVRFMLDVLCLRPEMW